MGDDEMYQAEPLLNIKICTSMAHFRRLIGVNSFASKMKSCIQTSLHINSITKTYNNFTNFQLKRFKYFPKMRN